MKVMTGIKLVNWHYFVNETIRLRGSTLITGDNGSGKSTIFDAIQMVLIGDQRRVRFNVSAHEATSRDLKGYLRCRTGRDDENGDPSQGYLRGGDFTSHVALEFHDAARRERFVVGFAVDTISGEPDTPQFFRHTGGLDDALFLDGNRPRTTVEFRALIRQRKGAEAFNSINAYRTNLLAQLGHLNDRFFSLLIKGLSFTPITDIRKFVYEYLLDAREIRIEAMLENFRQYRHYDHLVQQTKEKLARLTEISARYAERKELQLTAGIQEYVVLCANRAVAEEDLNKLKANLAEAQKRKAAAELEQSRLERSLEQLARELQELRDARARSRAYEALQAMDRRLDELRREVSELEQDGLKLSAEARQVVQNLSEALRLAEEVHPALALADEEPLGHLVEAIPGLRPLASGHLDAPPADLTRVIAALDHLSEQVLGTIKTLRDEAAALRREQAELEETIAELRAKRFRYSAAVEALRAAIRESLPGVEARVLCELIEVPDERWQNAVEGYLNTQRFDLLVPDGAFDDALEVYEQTKHERKIESVGLVNSEALRASRPAALPGSLAQEVATADPSARAHIDRLLGRVVKCETEQELKRHAVAITPTCMTYRNHTARQIEFRVYAVPFIGSRALVRQLELKQERLSLVLVRLEEIDRDLSSCERFRALVRSRALDRFPERWERLGRLPGLRSEIQAKERERAQIDVGELNALLRQIDEKEGLQGNLRQRKEHAVRTEQMAMRDIEHTQQNLVGAESTWQEQYQRLERYAAEHPEWAQSGAARYQDASRRTSPHMIAQNYHSNRQGILTQIQNLQNDLYRLRLQYNTHCQFGGAPDADENDRYDQELRKLNESELPLYESRIAEARSAAEQEFKEHFVFKLQENIRMARQEFENLNRVLKDIPFGQDRYQFVALPDRSHRGFYDMIMDDLALEGYNLFSAHFRERYGETLDELFRLILDVPEEKQAQNIERYTDYRTYLHFDIKILHESGETSTFSRVAREKSGGETQTPFYVAIVASFLQLYRPRQNPGGIRLLMFDEAFNRMDPDRAENTLHFVRRLGLQVLVAAPTDKCEIIAPHMETTLLVLRDGNKAWLEDYHQVLAAVPEESGEAEAAATGEVNL